MLPDYPQLLLFLTATILLNLTPGNDVLYIGGQSLHSKRNGLMATFGISTGIGIYILGTSFGLVNIIYLSPLTFNLIKVIGGAYLLYLAWQLFNKPWHDVATNNQPRSFGFEAYYKGILTTILNPKVGLFFLTFLPQFVDIAKGKIWLQLLSLGGCFILSGTLVNLMYVFLFSYIKKYCFTKEIMQKWFSKVTALLFCAIAVKVLTSRQN